MLTYGILFWGTSPVSKDIFKIQKMAIRIIANKGHRDSCKPLFKQFKILTLPSDYIYSILVFVLENRDLFVSNRDAHGLNTRNDYNLHLFSIHLTVVQRGVTYSGCKIFNSLPLFITENSENIRYFKKILKSYLLSQSFYSMEEFYQLTV
jgi:hypothetical protein